MISATTILKQLCNTASTVAAATNINCSEYASNQENITASTSNIASWIFVGLTVGGLAHMFFKKAKQQTTQTADNTKKLHFRGIGSIVG